MFSPSTPQLLSLLNVCGKSPRFEEAVRSAWKAVIKSVLDAPDSKEKEDVARSIFSTIGTEVKLSTEATESLEKLFRDIYNQAIEGNQSLWDLVSIALDHGKSPNNRITICLYLAG